MKTLMRHIPVLFLAIALCVGTRVAAEDAAPGFDEIRAALIPQRSADRSTAGGAQANAVALVVEFEGDSHRLTVNGMKTLRTLAGALQDPTLRTAKFEIIGHAYLPRQPTAALPLSSRRAQTVAGHLTAFYGIDDSQIVSVRGVGAEQLNTPNPKDPRNQRIEFINLGRN